MSSPLPCDKTAGVSESHSEAVTITPVQNQFCKNGHDDQPDAPDFPDGGLTAWGTALGVFLIQFCGFGYSSAYGVYEDFYTQTYLTNATPSAIAWIGSVNGFLILSVGLLSGRMLDRGAFYQVTIVGCLLQSFFLFMLSLTKPNGYYQIFLTQGIGSGFATGLTMVPSIAVVSHHFQRRRSFVMGLVVAGASLGSIFHPIMLNNLINGKFGFANGVRASAGMISALCLLMRTRLPPQPKVVSYSRVLKTSLTDPAYVCACLWMCTFEAGFFFETFYLQLDTTLHGLGSRFSFYSLAILHTGSFFGRFTAGLVSAYAGIPNTVVGSSLMSSAIIFAMIGLRSMASVALIGITYGYFAGVCIGMMAPLVSHLTPEISDLGIRMGISFAVGTREFEPVDVPVTCIHRHRITCAPICGALLTRNYIWWKPVVFAGSVAMCGSILFTSMQLILRIRQRSVKVCSKEAGV